MITERYIKMCEKAEEIQREWKPRIGDFVFSKEYKEVVVITGAEEELYDATKPILVKKWAKVFKEDYIWLPTQEQLQGMLDGDYFYHAFILDGVNETMKRLYSEDGLYSPFETGNEFWLAFVMWERYQKVWDDEKEEWVKGGNYEV